ncbi:MAG: FecR domain-containing protein [Spirochaetaceae bacterium]
MKATKVFLFSVVMGLMAVLLPAQQATAVVEYYDDEFEVQLFDADGFELQFFSFGQELAEGSRIRTSDSSLELRLVPNGSIVRVAPNTEVVIDRLQGETNVEMTMSNGRLRHVASRVSGADYRIRSGTVTAGVRGTDYVVTDNEIIVFSGLVEALSNATNEIVALAAGQAVNTLSETFQAATLSSQQLNERIAENDFVQLEPESVPQATETGEDEADDESEDETEDEEQDETETEVAEDDSESQSEEPASQVPPARVAPGPLPTIVTPSTGSVNPGISSDDAVMADFFGGLGEVLSMEIGSVTIDGETYAKAVLQPTLELGRLSLGLYLPIIYRSDLFNPDDWYQPRGNNEWSFGTDDSFAGEDGEVLLRSQDALRDLALKIRFLEFGEQRDPFFLKLGNLDNLTLGHGILMRNYANDSDFPAVRRLGFNLGLDGGGTGIELVANDLTSPSIFGTRVYVRPLGEDIPFAVGISGLTDVSPARDLPDPSELTGDLEGVEAAERIDPVFVNVAADIEIPVVESNPFSAVLFADVGGMIPFLRDSFTSEDGTTIEAGFRSDTLVVPGSSIRLRNYGVMTGVFGNIGPVDYRLDARNSNGVFQPTFYGQNYDRIRGDRAVELARYLLDPDAEEFDRSTYGIYGEAGADLFDIVRLEAGYLWPWKIAEGGGLESADSDELYINARIAPDTLPMGIYGGASYRRTEFAPTLLNRDGFAGATLFDANTTFQGELAYPVAPIMDIAGVMTTTVTRNPDGTVFYNDEGRPETNWSFTIETRIGM